MNGRLTRRRQPTFEIALRRLNNLLLSRQGLTVMKHGGGRVVARWLCAMLATVAATQAMAADRRTAEFLQDYITCEMWMKHHRTSAIELHAAVGRWIVDWLRRNSPNRLAHLDDAVIIHAVERHCDALPDQSISTAVFLSGLRLPEP